MPTGPDRADGDRRGSHRFEIGLAIVAVVALVIRVLFTLIHARHTTLIGDAETYHRLAENLAAGRGYIQTRGRGNVPTAEFPPLFPVVLAIVAKLGGAGTTTQRLFTSILGTGTVVVIGYLGRRVAGGVVGLVAAGLAAIYPMLFQPDTGLMAESLYALLIAAVLLATFRALDHPTFLRWAAAGALVGLAALTRTEALLLVPLVLLPLGLAAPPPRPPPPSSPDATDPSHAPWGRRFASAAVACGVAVAVIAPWVARNAVEFHQLIPISNNSGTLLAGANCDAVYSGYQTGLWRLDCVDAIDVTGLDDAEKAARLRSAGIDYAQEHASRVPAVGGIRILRTFGAWDPVGQIKWEFFEGRNQKWQGVGYRMYVVMVPFAIGGAVLLRRRRRGVWPLVAPVVLVAATSLVSYGSQRFRVAAEPGIIVLAAVGAVWVTGWLRTTLFRSRPEPASEPARPSPIPTPTAGTTRTDPRVTPP